MATTHITKELALRDIASVLARVSEGEAFTIDDGAHAIATLQPTFSVTGRELIEKLAQTRRLDVRMGADFADDVEDGIRLHRGDYVNSSGWDE